MLFLFNSGFLLCLRVFVFCFKCSKQNAHSFLRSGLVDLPFSHKCLWRHTLENNPIVWKREMQVLLPIESLPFKRKPYIAEFLSHQRTAEAKKLYTFFYTSISSAQCLAHSSYSINSGELHFIPHPPALELIISRNIHRNLTLHSSLPMYTQACHLVFSSPSFLLFLFSSAQELGVRYVSQKYHISNNA